jgi:hypothetical protein
VLVLLVLLVLLACCAGAGAAGVLVLVLVLLVLVLLVLAPARWLLAGCSLAARCSTRAQEKTRYTVWGASGLKSPAIAFGAFSVCAC